MSPVSKIYLLMTSLTGQHSVPPLFSLYVWVSQRFLSQQNPVKQPRTLKKQDQFLLPVKQRNVASQTAGNFMLTLLRSCNGQNWPNKRLVEVLSVEISCLCRLLIYTDNGFHLNLGFN